MTRYRDTSNTGTGLLIGLGVAAGIGTLVYYYLNSGVGEADAPLIPNSLERHFDRIVDALNRRFGKRWVNQGLSTVKMGLASVLPPQLVALVDVVHRVEQAGQQYGWTGTQKRYQAVTMARA